MPNMQKKCDDATLTELIRAVPLGAPVRNPNTLGALTHRHVDILKLSFMGLGASAVGSVLGIRPKTIHNHLNKMYRNVGATHLQEVIVALDAYHPEFTIEPLRHASKVELTVGEITVAQGHLLGVGVKQIAAISGITVKTVHNLASDITNKFDLPANTEEKVPLDIARIALGIGLPRFCEVAPVPAQATTPKCA